MSRMVRERKSSIQNILVFTKNWLGDVIFESAALRAIKENYPTAKLTCMSPPRCEEILRKNPFVDQVIAFDERREDRPLRRKWSLVRRLRREKYDLAIIFHRSFTRVLLAFLGGIPNRIGYRTKHRGFLLTEGVSETDRTCHQVDYFLNLLKQVGMKVDREPICEFYFSDGDDRRASTLLSDKGLDLSCLVALNPGANRFNKRWPPKSFARLADLLHQKTRCSFVITGSLQDDVLASEIIHQATVAKPISLCGDTALGELGAVYARCKLVVSGDSGPLHVAAGVGTSVVGLYGPTDPGLTGPRGLGRNIVVRPDHEHDSLIKSIEPEKVFERIVREGLL